MTTAAGSTSRLLAGARLLGVLGLVTAIVAKALVARRSGVALAASLEANYHLRLSWQLAFAAAVLADLLALWACSRNRRSPTAAATSLILGLSFALHRLTSALHAGGSCGCFGGLPGEQYLAIGVTAALCVTGAASIARLDLRAVLRALSLSGAVPIGVLVAMALQPTPPTSGQPWRQRAPGGAFVWFFDPECEVCEAKARALHAPGDGAAPLIGVVPVERHDAASAFCARVGLALDCVELPWDQWLQFAGLSPPALWRCDAGGRMTRVP